MYIIEVITNFFKKKKYKKSLYYSPTSIDNDELIENPQECNHLFLPLDSSEEVFACKYCGLIEKRENLKNKNIFENKSI